MSTTLATPATAPRVFIVLVIWNGKADTLACLASLREDRYPNFQVVVVDNASTDGSADVIRAEFPEVTVLPMSENLGFTGGNNAGIEHALAAGADYVYLLNNDTTVEPDALTAMVAAAEANPNYGMMVPVMHYHAPPRDIWFSNSRLDLRHGVAVHDHSFIPAREDAPYEVPWASGCALMLPAAVMREVKGFDDRYFFSWEDVDLSIRVRNTGRPIMVVPGARIYHKCGQSSLRVSRVHYYYAVRNNLLLVRKHAGRHYRFAALSIVTQALRHARRTAREKKGPLGQLLLSIWHGVRDHFLSRYGRYTVAREKPAATPSAMSGAVSAGARTGPSACV